MGSSMPARTSSPAARVIIGASWLLSVDRLSDLCGEDDLLRARDNLDVVALHRSPADPFHHACVAVGRVHPSLGQRLAIGRGRFAPGELAAMLGLPLRPPRKVRPVARLSVGLLPLEFLAAAAKPFTTRAAISKRRRQLI